MFSSARLPKVVCRSTSSDLHGAGLCLDWPAVLSMVVQLAAKHLHFGPAIQLGRAGDDGLPVVIPNQKVGDNIFLM